MNRAKWDSETIQISNALPSGEYATVRVYDNGGKTLDRYTVVFMDQPSASVNCWKFTTMVWWDCIGMSHDISTPQGFYQHSECRLGKHLGKRIMFVELPEAHRNRIVEELRSLKVVA